MTEYTIAPGQSNFRPLENPAPIFMPSGFRVAFKFDPSCWYSLEDWEGDIDWYDINKLKGLTYFFSANNRCSALIGWRPAKAENTFEVMPYTNDRKGRFQFSPGILVYAGEMVYAESYIGPNHVEYRLKYYGVETSYKHDFNRPWLRVFREVGTSIGGANNSPGKYGGYATQDMKLWADFEVVR